MWFLDLLLRLNLKHWPILLLKLFDNSSYLLTWESILLNLHHYTIITRAFFQLLKTTSSISVSNILTLIVILYASLIFIPSPGQLEYFFTKSHPTQQLSSSLVVNLPTLTFSQCEIEGCMKRLHYIKSISYLS